MKHSGGNHSFVLVMKVTWESDLCFKHTIWLWGSEGEGGNWLQGDHLRSG